MHINYSSPKLHVCTSVHISYPLLYNSLICACRCADLPHVYFNFKLDQVAWFSHGI